MMNHADCPCCVATSCAQPAMPPGGCRESSKTSPEQVDAPARQVDAAPRQVAQVRTMINSWQCRTDDPHEVLFWRIRKVSFCVSSFYRPIARPMRTSPLSECQRNNTATRFAIAAAFYSGLKSKVGLAAATLPPRAKLFQGPAVINNNLHCQQPRPPRPRGAPGPGRLRLTWSLNRGWHWQCARAAAAAEVRPLAVIRRRRVTGTGITQPSHGDMIMTQMGITSIPRASRPPPSLPVSESSLSASLLLYHRGCIHSAAAPGAAAVQIQPESPPPRRRCTKHFPSFLSVSVEFLFTEQYCGPQIQRPRRVVRPWSKPQSIQRPARGLAAVIPPC